MTKVLPALFLLLLLFWGCNHEMSKSELLDYAFDPTNGLYKKIEKSGVLIEVVYRPTELVVNQEVRGLTLSDHQLDSIQQYYRGIDYFLLRVSYNSDEIENRYAANPFQFNEINNYLSFEIGKDVYLVQKQDTLHVADFIRTRTYGSSPSTDILFAFKPGVRDDQADVKFIFEDKRFDTGINEFDFDINDIKEVSSIHLIGRRL